MSILDREVATYYDRLPELLDDAGNGKYVLIKGREILGVFGERSEALQVGHVRFLDESFLVKQILPEEQIRAFTRDLQVG